MINVFRSFFIFLLLWLSACGQKGPLYLEDKPEAQEQPTIIIDNPNANIIPDYALIDQLTISGQSIELNQNTAMGWEAVLTPEENTTNLIRYVVFNQNMVTSDYQTITMTIGSVQKKRIPKQARETIQRGNYLRFRSLERGVDQIPTLLNRIKHYFAANPQLSRSNGKDFLIENQQYIDIYIPVEKN